MSTSQAPEHVASSGESTSPTLADVGREARASAIKTAKDILEQVPKLLPLLGVLCYGLGLLIVDGFYSRLNTTPDAAGVGYLSVIEPAAVWAGVLAIIAVAMAMAANVVKEFWKRFTENIGFVRKAIQIVAALAFFAVITGFFVKNSALTRNIFILLAPAAVAIIVIPLELLVRWYRRPGSYQSAWSRVPPIGFSLILIVLLCFGAHYWGAFDAGKAVRGESVDVRIFGLDMSAIGATPVRIQAIDSSPAIKALSADACLLEIGSGSYSILLYDPADEDTLSIPLNDVVVISSSAPCKN